MSQEFKVGSKITIQLWDKPKCSATRAAPEYGTTEIQSTIARETRTQWIAANGMHFLKDRGRGVEALGPWRSRPLMLIAPDIVKIDEIEVECQVTGFLELSIIVKESSNAQKFMDDWFDRAIQASEDVTKPTERRTIAANGFLHERCVMLGRRDNGITLTFQVDCDDRTILGCEL